MSMFQPGEVIFVKSDQAKGYKTREKYHVCICGHQGRYFFINSKTWEGAFPLRNSDFPELPNEVSYVACNTLLVVSDAYMAANGARSVGTLSKQVIESLVDHIERCTVMTEEEKEIAIDGLSGAL